MAIMYAMRSPGIRIAAITTVAGNVDVDNCTRNVHTILDFVAMGERPEVHQGARKPLKCRLVTAPEVHGRDGLGNTQQGHPKQARGASVDAVACIRDMCEMFGQRLTIVAIGPLTNIALTLRRYPRSIRKAGHIVTMGGAFRVPGNTGPVAEFNYFVDPHAAHVVLNSGLPVTVVPLDVTQQTRLLRRDLRVHSSAQNGRSLRFIRRFASSYMLYHKQTEDFDGGYLHDPLAVALAIQPSLAKYARIHIDVESESPLTRGMTVADLRRKGGPKDPNVAISIHRDKFLRLFHQRVLSD